MQVTDEMVSRFLTWPLPGDVSVDPCAMALDYPGRCGTNLLTHQQARAMLEHVLGGSSDAETEAYAEGRDDERQEVRAEVLRELLEWEAEYMQQARGGDNTGASDHRADAAREIHDHLRSSWSTRDKITNPGEERAKA
jgi:hypothetical protein